MKYRRGFNETLNASHGQEIDGTSLIDPDFSFGFCDFSRENPKIFRFLPRSAILNIRYALLSADATAFAD